MSPGKADVDWTKRSLARFRGRRRISHTSPVIPAIGSQLRRAVKPGDDTGSVATDSPYTAPAFCAYSHDAFARGTVRLADSIAFALAAVPSRMRPAMPWVMPASRNRL